MSKIKSKARIAIANSNLMQMRMINGDDRYGLSRLTAEQIENYEAELGLIAQKNKQEIFYPGTPLDEMHVTYLKTAVIYMNDDFVRVDSVVKAILSRYNRETIRVEIAPASVILDTIMSATRAYSHPDLWLLVSWLYHAIPLAKQWLDGQLPFQKIVGMAVIEQMEVLKRTRGKIWLKKKNIDPDRVIEIMIARYGLDKSGHRFSTAYFDEAGRFEFSNLEIFQAFTRTFVEKRNQITSFQW